MSHSSCRQRLRWLFFFTLAALSMASSAQTTALDLGDTYLLALRQHPSIAIRADGILAADSELDAANWRRFPRAGIDLNNALAQQSDGGGERDKHGTTLRIEQPLWSGGRIDAEIDAARARQTLATLDKRQAEQDLLLRVAELFTERQRWQERLQIAEENLAEHRRLLALMERRSEQKVSSLADLTLAQARLQQALTEQQSFRLSEQKLLLNLGQVLGANLQGISLRPTRAADLRRADLAQVLAAAEATSPRLQRLQAEVDLARADAAARKAALYPQLSLRYEKFGGSAQILASDRLLLALEYQPDAGLGSPSAAEAALRRIAMASGGVELGQRELSDRVGEVFNEWRTFAEQSASAGAYAAATRAVMASYLRQFTAGRKTWQEVLNAQRELAQAAYAAIDTRHGEILASHRLAILTGELSPASLMQQKTP